MFQTSGTCTQQQPGIPEQVIQHLSHIRLENLLAPRWSIVLNEHGCQLQVFWGAPKTRQNSLKVATATNTTMVKPCSEPQIKKQRLEDIPTPAISSFVNSQGLKPAGSIPGFDLGSIPLRQVNAMRSTHTVSPKSPKLTKQTSAGNGTSRELILVDSSPSPALQIEQAPILRNCGIYNLPETTTVNTMRSFPTNSPILGTKIAQVSIPAQPRKENRKSIEITAQMLLGQKEFQPTPVFPISTSPAVTNEKVAPLSPQGIVTPPSSERSSSGDGKEPERSEHGEENSGGNMDFMSDLYRQKFSCEICRKTFTRKYSLSRHYKEVHQGESRSNKFQSLGPSMVAIGGLSEHLNDFGLPSMARLPYNQRMNDIRSPSNSEADVKIEEYDEDESSPSMVIKRHSPIEF
jgi:hypothetical protein